MQFFHSVAFWESATSFSPSRGASCPSMKTKSALSWKWISVHSKPRLVLKKTIGRIWPISIGAPSYSSTTASPPIGRKRRTSARCEAAAVKAKKTATRKKNVSPSTKAGEYVREEAEHIRQGKHGARSSRQAIAIGLSKARRAGIQVPPARGKTPTRRPPATGRKNPV